MVGVVEGCEKMVREGYARVCEGVYLDGVSGCVSEGV